MVAQLALEGVSVLWVWVCSGDRTKQKVRGGIRGYLQSTQPKYDGH